MTVHWVAQGECDECGWRGDHRFEDGDWVESDHDCEEDE